MANTSKTVKAVDLALKKSMRAFAVVGVTKDGKRIVLAHANGEADTATINEMFADVTTKQLLGEEKKNDA